MISLKVSNIIIIKLLPLILTFGTFNIGHTQVYTNKELGQQNQKIIDSLKNSDYPYILPILGAKATKAGFSLPYSSGLSINYLWQNSDIVINNLQVGFNNGPMYEMSDVVRFNNTSSTTNAINIRPDFWLFPFLNVYGIFARSSSGTSVDFEIFVPNGKDFQEIINMSTKADFEGTSIGFGLTPTIGIANGWFALDMNFSWTDIEALSKPAYSFIIGSRLGKTFRFKREHSNLAVWIGGFRIHINSSTNGSLSLNSVIDTENLQEEISNGFIRLDEAQQQLDAWWAGLSPAEQRALKAVNDRVNNAITKVGAILDDFSNGVARIDESTVQYSLDKKQKNLWNFLVGAQYQFNRHWMCRVEYGFLSSRQQLIGGLQYRFGL